MFYKKLKMFQNVSAVTVWSKMQLKKFFIAIYKSLVFVSQPYVVDSG